MWKQAGVQHVGVCHHHVSAFADRGPAARRRVAVVRIDADFDRETRLERPKLGELVLRQRLRWIQVEGALLRVLEQSLQDGEVVTKRFSAGRGGDDHQVPAATDSLVGLSLVRVEAFDAAPT